MDAQASDSSTLSLGGLQESFKLLAICGRVHRGKQLRKGELKISRSLSLFSWLTLSTSCSLPQFLYSAHFIDSCEEQSGTRTNN